MLCRLLRHERLDVKKHTRYINIEVKEMSEKIIRIGVSMPEDVHKAAKELAHSKGLNLSSFIRTLLIEQSNQIDTDNDTKIQDDRM